jgi:hypothetical protein
VLNNPAARAEDVANSCAPHCCNIPGITPGGAAQLVSLTAPQILTLCCHGNHRCDRARSVFYCMYKYMYIKGTTVERLMKIQICKVNI